MEKENDGYEKQLFETRRSLRYHLKRVSFYERLNDWTTFLNLIFSTSTIYSLVSKMEPNTVAILAGFVSILTALSLVFKYSDKLCLHRQLVNDFKSLEIKITNKEASIESLVKERGEIEKNEPPHLRCLNQICYDEELQASKYDTVHNVGVIRGFFANWF